MNSTGAPFKCFPHPPVFSKGTKSEILTVTMLWTIEMKWKPFSMVCTDLVANVVNSNLCLDTNCRAQLQITSSSVTSWLVSHSSLQRYNSNTWLHHCYDKERLEKPAWTTSSKLTLDANQYFSSVLNTTFMRFIICISHIHSTLRATLFVLGWVNYCVSLESIE